MMRRVALAALVLVMPGCLQDSEGLIGHGGQNSSKATAYGDASVRAFNTVAGEDTTQKSLNVPAGADRLTVKAWYSVAGSADFVLRNPAGLVVREDHPEGAKELRDDDWYEQDAPTPGAWSLLLTVEGSGDYAFGAYF